MKIKERLTSWATWVSVLGALGVIFKAFGLFERIGVTEAVWQDVITAMGTVLVGFGILNNPTDKQHF